jgi:RNA polymerase sigma-70 factor (ECF subfamily)
MHHELNHFLTSVEKKAFRMARMATKNTEPALDIVQDTMMVLSLKYANKDEKEWPALFYRILQNKIIDWHRKQTVKNKLFSLFGFIDDHIERHDGSVDSSHFPTSNTMTPDKAIENTDINNSTMLAIEQLPVRQQQAFLLRQWQGLSIRETADAMSISEGSVKTHYSRAISQLKSKLEGIYYEQT